MILWLLRHPRTAVPEGVCYGRSDVELDFKVPLASALRVERKEGAARLLAHTGCERSRLPAWMR